MKPQQLIKHFGSQAKVAKAFGVTRAAVQQWCRAGVLPLLRQYQARELIGKRR